MNRALGLDLGNNSIGWALIDSSANKAVSYGIKIFPQPFPNKRTQQRFMYRQAQRRTIRAAQRLSLLLSDCDHAVLIDKIKIIFPLFVHTMLAVLFSASLLIAFTHPKDFQFWLNLSISILLGWIAFKK